MNNNSVTKFNFDIVWRAIAISLAIGVVVFYFIGLQPIILKSYVNFATQKTSKLQKKFDEQSQKLNDVAYAIFETDTDFDPLEPCSESQKVDLETDEFKTFNSFATSLLPDQNLKDLGNYSVFADGKIKEIYKDLYQNYENSLANQHESYEKSSEFVKFLDYRNVWIDSCESFQQTKGSLQESVKICQSLTANETKLSNFDFYNNSIKETVKKSNDKCAELTNYAIPSVTTSTTKNSASTATTKIAAPIKNTQPLIYPNYNKWLADWFTGFQNLMNYKFDFSSILDSASKVKLDFDKTTSDTKAKLIEYEESKDSLLNKWYFLEIKL